MVTAEGSPQTRSALSSS